MIVIKVLHVSNFLGAYLRSHPLIHVFSPFIHVQDPCHSFPRKPCSTDKVVEYGFCSSQICSKKAFKNATPTSSCRTKMDPLMILPLCSPRLWLLHHPHCISIHHYRSLPPAINPGIHPVYPLCPPSVVRPAVAGPTWTARPSPTPPSTPSQPTPAAQKTPIDKRVGQPFFSRLNSRPRAGGGQGSVDITPHI